MPTHSNLKLYEINLYNGNKFYNRLLEEIIGIGQEIKENLYCIAFHWEIFLQFKGQKKIYLKF